MPLPLRLPATCSRHAWQPQGSSARLRIVCVSTFFAAQISYLLILQLRGVAADGMRCTPVRVRDAGVTQLANIPESEARIFLAQLLVTQLFVTSCTAERRRRAPGT